MSRCPPPKTITAIGDRSLLFGPGRRTSNPDTAGDPAWTPLRPTPPNQDYASGHSIEGGVGAEVLKQVFGTDGVSFQDCGVKLPAGSACGDPSPVLRSYSSFSQAATENAFIAHPRSGSISANLSKKGPQYGRKIRRARRHQLPPACALSDAVCPRGYVGSVRSE